MKYRIRSKVKATTHVGQNAQPVVKIIQVDEILEFDHEPSDDEIQSAFERHPAYDGYILQWQEVFKKERVK